MPSINISLSKPWSKDLYLQKNLVDELHSILKGVRCIDEKLLKYSCLEMQYHQLGEETKSDLQMVDLELRVIPRQKHELEAILNALASFAEIMENKAKKSRLRFCFSLYVHLLKQERLIVLKG